MAAFLVPRWHGSWTHQTSPPTSWLAAGWWRRMWSARLVDDLFLNWMLWLARRCHFARNRWKGWIRNERWGINNDIMTWHRMASRGSGQRQLGWGPPPCTRQNARPILEVLIKLINAFYIFGCFIYMGNFNNTLRNFSIFRCRKFRGFLSITIRWQERPTQNT